MKGKHETGSLKFIEKNGEPLDEKDFHSANTLRFMKTVGYPTLILIDTNFLRSEFKLHREFYADLYSGKNERLPKKPELPKLLSHSLLYSAICKYGNAYEDNTQMVLFYDGTGDEIVTSRDSEFHSSLDIPQPIWLQMECLISKLTFKPRIIFLADDHRYSLLIQRLLEKDCDIAVIKHFQEKTDDTSEMPDDLPFQYGYYVIGEAMGLKANEL